MAKHDVVDLLKYAHENRPANFETTFKDVMRNKINAALDAKREVISHQMMNGSEDDDSEIDIEEE